MAKWGTAVSHLGKTRIPIMLHDDVIDHFRSREESEGMGYQTLTNALPRESLKKRSAETSRSGKLPCAAFCARRCPPPEQISGHADNCRHDLWLPRRFGKSTETCREVFLFPTEFGTLTSERRNS